MKVVGMIKSVAVGLAVVGFCLPPSVLAAPINKSTRAVNVTLTKSGALLGQVVDTSGVPKSNIPVTIHSGKQKLSAGKTDKQGYFAFQGVRGGTYRLAAANGQGAYCVWAHGTAPPKAQQGALIVSDNNLVRGNNCGDCGQCDSCRGGRGGLFGGGGGRGGGGGGIGQWLSNPWVIAGIVATAVVVPVVVHNAQDDDEPSSP